MATKVGVKSRRITQRAGKIIVEEAEVTARRMDQDPERETIVEILDSKNKVADTIRLSNGEDATFVVMETHSIKIRESDSA